MRREVRFFEAEYLVAVTIILSDAKTVKSRHCKVFHTECIPETCLVLCGFHQPAFYLGIRFAAFNDFP